MRKSLMFFILGAFVGAVVCAMFIPYVYSEKTPAKSNVPQRDKVVAIIGPVKITVGDLEDKINSIPAYARKNFLTIEGKLKILENMVKGEILYLAAKDAGYDKNPEIQAKVEDTKKRIYQSEYFKNEIKDVVLVDDKLIKDYYNSHLDEFKKEEMVRIRHIQVNTEQEANEIYQKLLNGEKFSELVEKYSTDTTTTAYGGALGAITRNDSVRGIGYSKPFIDAAFALNKGEFSKPVQTSKGWHIIYCDDHTPESYKPLEEVKAIISDKLLVTEADIEKEYNQNKSEYIAKERVKIAHIQVDSEKKAKEILSQLKKGANFEELARKESLDNYTATKGGEIGFIYRDSTIRGIGKDIGFENAAFNLRPGQLSDIVKTAKGYHIIKCLAYEPERQKSLSEVTTLITNKLLREKREQRLEKEFDRLKAKYKVKVFEEYVVDTSDTYEELPPAPPPENLQFPELPFPLGQ